MPTILADHDVEGHLRILIRIWSSPDWSELWAQTNCAFESFERLGLEPDTPDSDVWRLCQQRQIILITGNRNAEGEDSLEATIRREATADSLPVFTIGDPGRLVRDRRYAERVAARMYGYLQMIDHLRGAGRLYLP